MKKCMFKIKIPVSVLREGKKYVAYTPALDLSTSGKSYKEVKKRFEEIVDIFFNELLKKDTMEETLKDLGWRKASAGWSAPQVISQESQTVCIPV